MSSVREKIFLIFVYLLVLALPFIYSAFFFNPYEFPKFLFFVSSMQIIMIFYSLSTKNLLQETLTNKSSSQLFWLIMLFGLIVLISNIFGANIINSLLGGIFRHQGFLTLLSSIFLFITISSCSKKSIDQTVYFLNFGIFVTIFLLFLISFLQFIQFFVLRNYSVPVYNGRIIGTFGNPNALASYISMLFPFILWPVKIPSFLSSYRLFSAIKIFLFLAAIVTVFLSGSKSGLISIIIIFFVFVTSFIKTRLKSKLVFYLVISLISVFVLYGGFKLTTYLFNRSSPWDNRQLIWKEGVQKFLKRPFLGYGQENFEFSFPGPIQVKADNAHNIFLEVAVSSGIFGLLVFVLIILVAIKNAAFPIKLSLVSFLIASFFNPLSIPQTVMFWFLIGIGSKIAKKY